VLVLSTWHYHVSCHLLFMVQCPYWCRFGTEHWSAAGLHEDQNRIVTGRVCRTSSCSSRPGLRNIFHRETLVLCKFLTVIFTARRSYASAVLGVVILSVCLSHTCFVTNPKNLPAIFLYHMNDQSFQFSDAKDLGEIPTESPPMGAPNRGTGVG